MKRQSTKTNMILSSIFLLALLSAVMLFIGQSGSLNKRDFLNLAQLKVTQVPPLKGHWLRTAKDPSYPVPPLEKSQTGKKVPFQNVIPTVFTLEEAKSALNRTIDLINVMYVWSDADELKVISVTSFNKETKQAAIIVIPLYTVIDNTGTVNLQNNYTTIQELYKSKGREGVRTFLEQKLEIEIPNFVQVNQSALQKISDIIGALEVNGSQTTMLEAFEQTAAGLRTDDREVVRAVAVQVLRPGIILEIPNLIYIFTHDIETNFSTQEMINVFYMSRQMDLKHMRKTAMPGYEHLVAPEKKFLFVSEQAWKNVVYDITQSFPL